MHFDECLRGSGLWLGEITEAQTTWCVWVKNQRFHPHTIFYRPAGTLASANVYVTCVNSSETVHNRRATASSYERVLEPTFLG
jgi:hypothetical protein